MYKNSLFSLLSLFVLLALSSPVFAQIPYSEEWDSGEGDFTTEIEGDPTGQWVYNDETETWSATGHEPCAPVATSRLISPDIEVLSAGSLKLEFEHRYSFEFDGTTLWDSGAIMLSVNGSEPERITGEQFIENGYAEGNIGGNGIFKGLRAFNGDSEGYVEGEFIISEATLGTFEAGDIINVQFVCAFDDCTANLAPNWEINNLFVTHYPTAVITADPFSGAPPLEVNFDGSGSFIADGNIVEYEWDFGEGETASGEKVSHTFTIPGLYPVTLTVTDNKGQIATTHTTVNVNCVGGDTSPWTSIQIGEPAWVGCGMNQAACVEMFASGAGFRREGDEINLLHQTVTGDATLTTKISDLVLVPGAGAGIMMRSSDAADSAFFKMTLRVRSDGTYRAGVTHRQRPGLSTPSRNDTVAIEDPSSVTLRIQRTGIAFSGSYSTDDGQTWKEVRAVELTDPPDSMIAGPALTADDDDAEGIIVRATFCEITGFDGDPNPGITFRRGDVDVNGLLEVTDPINNLTFQFLGTYNPTCMDALDFDDNGAIEITDPIGNLSHQFLGTAPPAPPGAETCGADPTEDTVEGGDLTCVDYPAESCN